MEGIKEEQRCRVAVCEGAIERGRGRKRERERESVWEQEKEWTDGSVQGDFSGVDRQSS